MFQSARLKLTAWYLLMITIISIVFTVGIYRLISPEIDHMIERQQFRMERAMFNPFDQVFVPALRQNIQELHESQNRLRWGLIITNIIIIGGSGLIGYFLAGRTLRPIQNMVNEQHRFISDASHELRTPLTALRTELETSLLEEKLDPQEAKAVLQSNLEEVINLQSLADNLLQLAHFQYNGQHKINHHTNIQDITADAIKKVTPMAKKKNLTIHNYVTDHTIKGDKTSLTQLFVILLDNAIKYSPEDKNIYLDGSFNEKLAKLTIRDEGIGMSEEELNHIFDRFYRADRSRSKSDASGYGLGLAIAKKIIEEHHGNISVKSKPHDGTTFIVQLPLN
jgi:two-component system, OmpR family, sensor histidine kinase CiaH